MLLKQVLTQRIEPMISYFLVQTFDPVTRDDRFLLELTNHILRSRNARFKSVENSLSLI